GPEGAPRGLAACWETAYCCVELSDLGADDEDEWRYLTFTATEPVRASADRKAVERFVRRVNRRLKLVRASFDGEEVGFDYTAVGGRRPPGPVGPRRLVVPGGRLPHHPPALPRRQPGPGGGGPRRRRGAAVVEPHERLRQGPPPGRHQGVRGQGGHAVPRRAA